MTMKLVGVIAATLALTVAAQAQDYPSKPIRMVIPFAAGGPTDIVARSIGERLSIALKQPVLVDNRPGGNTTIGAVAVAKAAPDGYTLLMTGMSTMAVLPHLDKKTPYNSLQDFVPISQTSSQSVMLVVTPSLPVKNLKDYLALARTKPGGLNFATSGNASSGHMAGALLQTVTGVQLTHIPYKGGSPALNDVIGGQVESMFTTLIAGGQFVKNGRLVAIAITGSSRNPAFPDVPTFEEAGLANFDPSAWSGIYAPKGTPPAVIDTLNRELRTILQSSEVAGKMAADGSAAVPSTPEQFSAKIKSEYERWGEVVKKANVTLD